MKYGDGKRVQNEYEYRTTTTLDPPDDSGTWQRVYSVGIGPVMGAGGSPARPSRRKDPNGND